MYLKDQITFPNLGNKGRLGNQLFQIAATISVARNYDLGYGFPDWEYNKFLKNKIPIINDLIPTHFYVEPSFRYTHIDLDQSISNRSQSSKIYALDGYFQSIKYFEKHEAFIRKQFTPRIEILNNLFHKYGHLSSRNCAIHVRRGDYVDLAYYHQIKMDYYEKSMLEINKKTGGKRFVIFSDDIEWCKANFTNQNYAYIFIEGNTDFEDLILMSFFDYQIIANSTFSWWSSFLNPNPNKIVIFPEKWFGEVANLDATDLYY